MDVTKLEQNFQEKITLNSLQYTTVQTNFEFKVGSIFLVFGRYFICKLGLFTLIFIMYIFLHKKKMVSFVRL